MCVHGRPKSAPCHDGECCRDKPASLKDSANARRVSVYQKKVAEKKVADAKNKFENIKAKLLEAGTYVSDSEITDTLDDYFVHGGRKQRVERPKLGESWHESTRTATAVSTLEHSVDPGRNTLALSDALSAGVSHCLSVSDSLKSWPNRAMCGILSLQQSDIVTLICVDSSLNYPILSYPILPLVLAKQSLPTIVHCPEGV